MRSVISLRLFIIAMALYGAQAIAAPLLACCNPGGEMTSGEHVDHAKPLEPMSKGSMHHHEEAEPHPQSQGHDPECDNHCGLCLVATGLVLSLVIPGTAVHPELPQPKNINPALPTFLENPYKPPILA